MILTKLFSPVDQEPESQELTFTEIRNLYFDAVIQKEIEKTYGNIISWEFNGRTPNSRDCVKLLSVIVTTEGGSKKTMAIDLTRILNCKAREIDVENFIDDKTDQVKAFITNIILEVDKAPEGLQFFKKSVSEFTVADTDRIISVLSDEGIRVFAKDGILTVYIPQNM